MKRRRTRNRAMQTNDSAHYALAYSAGWNAAADGDISGHASALDLTGDPAFEEGAAAFKAGAVTARPSFIGGLV